MYAPFTYKSMSAWHAAYYVASNMLFTYNRLGWLDGLITISGTHLSGATLDNSQSQTNYLDLQTT